MTNRFGHLGRILGALAALFAASMAHATLVTADFDGAGNEILVAANYNESGFRFSSSCHYDRGAFGSTGFGGTKWLGFDGSACGSLANPDYTGPASVNPAMFIESIDGAAFTLDSLQVAVGGFTLTSSNGGSVNFDATTSGTQFLFFGSVWTNVQWLLLTSNTFNTSPIGIDHFTADVGSVPASEPTTLMLSGMLLVGFAAARRRKLSPRWNA